MENLRLSKPLVRQKKLLMSDAQKTNNFNWPLSDLEIIKLQKILMTPTIHHITTQNILSGRVLMDTILKSLQYYNFIGCLTTSQILLDDDIAHMYNLFQDYTQTFEDTCGLEEFFLTYFQFDFVWIELSEGLLNKFSINEIQKICESLASWNSIPVVIISYEN